MSDNSRKGNVIQIGEQDNEVHYIVDNENINKGPKFGCRHVQAILLCFGLICAMGQRTGLSVAIVAMTDKTSPNPDVPVYDWKNTSIILSSFFWSYITLQVAAGYLGKTYGPKYFYLTGIFINCCACALTPLAAEKMGSSGVLLCRVIQGFGQGFLYPSTNVLLGRWVPDEERTTLCNFVGIGGGMGHISGTLITGLVSSSWWGWPASFYILSSMGFGWCIIWLCFGQNSPAVHPRITLEEKKYIQASLKQEDDLNLPVPWKKIFTCRPFYAIMATYIGTIWGYSIMMTEKPTYLAKYMNFTMTSNALISSMPTLVYLCTSLVTGPMSDWIIAKRYLTKRNSRRIFDLIGSFGQAACLCCLSFLKPSQAYLSVVTLGVGNALSAFIDVGSVVNHLDLSPRFSGIMFAILNAVGQCCSIFAPLTANWIITDPTNVSQWRIVFLVAAGFFMVGTIIFFFFSSATRQPWDGPEDNKQKERQKKVSVFSVMSY